MTFFSYFQTFYVLRKCKLKGKDPIKVSLTDYTQEKLKITFKRQFTAPRDVFIRMHSKDHEPSPTSLSRADSTAGSPRSQTGSPTSQLGDEYGKMGKLYFNIINEEKGFSLFCLHLTKQWSIENMVGLIEFAQLLRLLLPLKPPDLDLELGLLEDYRFENVEELPKSDIVFNHEKYKTLSSKIIALFEKYVSPTCKFQINLSSRVRYQWINEVIKLEVPVVEKPTFGRRFTDSFNKHKRKPSKESSRFKKPSSVPVTPSEVETASKTDVLQEDVELGPSTSIKSPKGRSPVGSRTPSHSIDRAQNAFVTVTDEENQDDGELVTQESLNKYMSMDIKQIQEEEKKEVTIPGVKTDIDVGKFLLLIQRILEQCHLLLMDSYSRFRTERNRQIEYDMHDRRVLKQHSMREVKPPH